ncbi:MAG TPA: hypothetical protein VFO94_04305, partial [Gammaproteobacteria bacterium]|nr:hypothetical protein [Gammaproteobacteria bacterium]
MPAARAVFGGFVFVAAALGVDVAVAQSAADDANRAALASAHAEYEAALRAGDVSAGLAALETALTIGAAVYPEDGVEIAALQIEHAQLLEASGARADAYREFVHAGLIYTRAFGPDSVKIIPVLMAAGRTDRTPADRARWIERALENQPTGTPEQRLDYARLATQGGESLATNRGGTPTAVPMLEKALEILAEAYGEDSAELVPTLAALADAKAALLDSAPQLNEYRRALRIVESKFGERSDEYNDLALRAGRRLLLLSSSPAGRGFLFDAYDNFHAMYGPDNEKSAAAALARGEFETASGHHKDAVGYLEEALAFYGNKPVHRLTELRIHTLLARGYEDLNKSDLATPHLLAIGRASPPAAGQDLTPIFQVAPDYPPYALRKGIEGWVKMTFDVD